jgi:hypothetical protein
MVEFGSRICLHTEDHTVRTSSRSGAGIIFAAILVIVFVVSSCTTDIGDNFIGTGTIVYLSIEGGFYGIKGDDGRSYDPVNLSNDFRKDGLRVRFEAKELKGQASFHMWGSLVQIIHIQPL